MLLSLFTLFCFKCKENTKPTVEMVKNGTMVTICQNCDKCGKKSFVWRSQPFIGGRYPAGNILLSFGVLIAGASISKILLVLKHMGLTTYKARTYFLHQSNFLFPAVFRHWELYRAALINEMQNLDEIVVCGDGRFDSMGHSAKYGAYTIFCSNIKKIVHFQIIQVWLYT